VPETKNPEEKIQMCKEFIEMQEAGIKSVSDYRKAVRSGAYAWPGGYPLFFVTSDGAALCWNCGAKKERRNVLEAIRDKSGNGWRIVAVDINWEDGDLCCDNCSERIESAYAEPKEEEKSSQD
jgi:hypothetical protein